MNIKIKKRWLAALRGGRYEQITVKLYDGKGFCCLGVLCDLYLKEHKKEWDNQGWDKRFFIEDNSSGLPEVVQKWAGIEVGPLSYRVPLSKSYGGENTLTELNDKKLYSFNQIAEVIEKEL